MPISRQTVTRLTKVYPHSADMLRAFVPLLNAREKLAETLDAPDLPALDAAAFAQGKPWVSAAELPLGADFLKKAPKALATAAAKGFPEKAEDFAALGAYLVKHPEEVEALTRGQLRGQSRKIADWAKKHGFDKNVVALLAMHLAGSAAVVARKGAADATFPLWGRAHCPFCGGTAHAFVIRGKEGARFLQCGLCGMEYRFSRTACAVCGKEALKELPYYFVEGHPEHQAEACEACRSYLLGLDARNLSEAEPLELHALCMLPLDMLMQEKGFAPAASAVS